MCDTIEIPAEFVRETRRELVVRYACRNRVLPRPQCGYDREDLVVVMPLFIAAREGMLRYG